MPIERVFQCHLVQFLKPLIFKLCLVFKQMNELCSFEKKLSRQTVGMPKVNKKDFFTKLLSEYEDLEDVEGDIKCYVSSKIKVTLKVFFRSYTHYFSRSEFSCP